uniref:G_PROTEIN_RECEP_F1_2 domain-containing protein n=1 Tax=Steinernema glaseri TaxID=37863 RepID=A0A1I7ZA74_9BILA
MFLRIFIGVYNLCIFLVFFPANVALIWVICKSRGLRKLWSYRIIANIALADGLMLTTVLSAGLMSLLNSQLPHGILKGIMALIDCVANAELILNFVLTTNRMLVMLQLSRFDKPSLYKVLLATAWSIGIAVLVMLATFLPLSPATYNLDQHFFTQDVDNAYLMARFWLCCSVFALSALMCVVVVLKLTFQRQKASSEDVRLFVQAVLPYVWLLIFELISNRQRMMQEVLGATSSTIIFNVLGRSIPGFHFTVYMIFNRTLRREIMTLIGMKKKNRVKVITFSRVTVVSTL